jgi:hypothetical protein
MNFTSSDISIHTNNVAISFVTCAFLLQLTSFFPRLKNLFILLIHRGSRYIKQILPVVNKIFGLRV